MRKLRSVWHSTECLAEYSIRAALVRGHEDRRTCQRAAGGQCFATTLFVLLLLQLLKCAAMAVADDAMISLVVVHTAFGLDHLDGHVTTDPPAPPPPARIGLITTGGMENSSTTVVA